MAWAGVWNSGCTEYKKWLGFLIRQPFTKLKGADITY